MQRPASVTVFGVLNLVFGGLGMLSLPFTILALTSNPTPPFQVADEIGLYQLWTFVSLAISALGLVALLASGVGLLRMRPWGRTLAVVYAALTVSTTLIALGMHWFFVAQPTFAQTVNDDSPEAMFARAGAIGGLVGGLIGLAFPVLLWFFMTRPRVLAAFAGPTPTAALPRNSGHDTGYVPRNEPTNPFSAPATAELPVWTPDPNDPNSITETFIPSKNGPALASYYLGIFSLFPCLGFPLGVAAVYFGIQGIRRARNTPEVRGGIHAWVGTICGALFGLFNFALIVLAVFAFTMS